MPCVILCGTLAINTPQQNAGTFIGQYNMGGWDANMKTNYGHGATLGFFNVIPFQFNINVDNFEFVDGMINDQDFKPQFSGNA
ncbi:hypothetical protein LLE49_23010 [Alicyclobacillus tolerans]|uniref:hypothetical protein n=1 Tax=Alicyclobacillus tolerans TaxID=90970 RepID=UPI001F461D40|nr:hypothetical protein [Alicyclobacillus tolerans]MCF8567595.1 hypothetical protein [Alicyclobacillus tolerans]